MMRRAETRRLLLVGATARCLVALCLVALLWLGYLWATTPPGGV